MGSEKARVYVEQVMIPTYGIGKADKNPMFFEKRAYQGSSGKVYPLPVIESIEDTKEDKPYQAVFLENEYLKVMVLPELGGRIQRAYDKTNGYDFVYYNEVIKPALVGLCGPWISGGIEFNWPQHHRPTTFSPVDYTIREYEDGHASVFLSEVDQMYGTKGEMVFSLYPGKAYIEIKGRLYNRTNLPQTFLWWANPAVPVNDNTQSIFPPDVHAVFDHGKRDVSKFPIATGVYYKHDYGAGVDISRYKNIPVPTSYMCAHSDYNFVGGYDYGREAGVLHVADHHVSPGKKQWTWGCGDFGKAWDRNLTDINGPYIELMTGVFTDNQPDFTFLKPFEEKTFTQYFMPYKKVGAVKNATRDLAAGLEKTKGGARITVYASGKMSGVTIALQSAPQSGADGSESVLYSAQADLSPVDVFEVTVPTDVPEEEWLLKITSESGRELLAYRPEKEKIEKIPEPMKPIGAPEDVATTEELYLDGVHLEQYRHATYQPDPYYLEGLKRDPDDIRLNTAYGMLLLRRACFEESEPYFRRAIARATLHNPNPYDGEPYYDLGLSLFYQGRFDEAYDAFFKSTWSAEQQERGFYYVAAIDCRRGDYEEALEHIEKSLIKNWHSLKARALRGMILEKLGRTEEAVRWNQETLAIDPFAYTSALSVQAMPEDARKEALLRMNGRVSSFIESAIDCAEAGFFDKAQAILTLSENDFPMVHYGLAFCLAQQGLSERACAELARAAESDSLYCFPNRLEDAVVLSFATKENPADAKAFYYLGCLCYDKRQYEKARTLWEESARLDPSFPTVWRNLALEKYNKEGCMDEAVADMEKAFALDETDSRVLQELNQLYRKTGMSPEKRFAFLDAHKETTLRRDDLTIEYAGLLNLLGRFEEACSLMTSRRFHPWEGGEGKATTQYKISLVGKGIAALNAGRYEEASSDFQKALTFPENLGEGKLEGEKDNDLYYFLGLAERKLGHEEAAEKYLSRAAQGDEEPASAMFYNDQPADMIFYEGMALSALGQQDRANARFHKLVDYGEKHYYDQVKIDYFAVSLPDLQLFDEDLNKKNREQCDFLIALGSYGLGQKEKAQEYLHKTLSSDPSAEKAALLSKILTF